MGQEGILHEEKESSMSFLFPLCIWFIDERFNVLTTVRMPSFSICITYLLIKMIYAIETVTVHISYC